MPSEYHTGSKFQNKADADIERFFATFNITSPFNPISVGPVLSIGQSPQSLLVADADSSSWYE